LLNEANGFFARFSHALFVPFLSKDNFLAKRAKTGQKIIRKLKVFRGLKKG
jgi:hypothetical protein